MKVILTLVMVVLITSCAINWDPIRILPPGYSGKVAYITSSSGIEGRHHFSSNINGLKQLGTGNYVRFSGYAEPGKKVTIPVGDVVVYTVVYSSGMSNGLAYPVIEFTAEAGRYYVIENIFDHYTKSVNTVINSVSETQYQEHLCKNQKVRKMISKQAETPACYQGG